MSNKINCAMCSYELEVPEGVEIPEDCDVVCGDCGTDIAKFLGERATNVPEGTTLQ